MIKKTLYFGNPAYLSLKNEQMVIKLPDVEHSNLHENLKDQAVTTIPIEDIGVVILDNSQITITQGLIAALMQNTVAFITCDNQRMPIRRKHGSKRALQNATRHVTPFEKTTLATDRCEQD